MIMPVFLCACTREAGTSANDLRSRRNAKIAVRKRFDTTVAGINRLMRQHHLTIENPYITNRESVCHGANGEPASPIVITATKNALEPRLGRARSSVFDAFP
jgi:hypothetical protein